MRATWILLLILIVTNFSLSDDHKSIFKKIDEAMFPSHRPKKENPQPEKENPRPLYSMHWIKDLPEDIHPSELRKWVPTLTDGRVIKVHDGDSITIASRMPKMQDSEIYKFPVRIHGIDAPEITGKTPEERHAAIYARDRMKELVYDKDVKLANVAYDQYGRI